MLLISRKIVLFSIDGAPGGGEDELLHSGAHAILKQVERAQNIDIRVIGRFPDRLAYIHLSSVVVHHIKLIFCKYFCDLLIPDVHFQKFSLRIEVLFLTGN